jgi:hypothetical protein
MWFVVTDLSNREGEENCDSKIIEIMAGNDHRLLVVDEDSYFHHMYADALHLFDQSFASSSTKKEVVEPDMNNPRERK